MTSGRSNQRPSLAEVGRQAAHDAQRDVLRAELARQDWNLSAVARELGLHNASNVIRAIRRLGLDRLYEEAREAGKVLPGGRSD